MTRTPPRLFVVTETESGQRLDRFLVKNAPELSRSRLQNLIRDGAVKVNDARANRAREPVRSGDRVVLLEPELTKSELMPEQIPFVVLFEDEDLLVLNKPAGISVHPGAGRTSGTLVNALLAHCRDLSGIGGQERPGIVHRLDKDTSGCLVVAKNDAAHIQLSQQFAARTVDKIYLALVMGRISRDAGRIEASIGRHRIDRKRMAVEEKGRSARTDYRVLRRGDNATLLECRLHSGRTHQIRVHLKHLGYPVLGDTVYGSRGAAGFERHMLHAWKLAFEHPRTKKRMPFEAPLPEDFEKAIASTLG